MKTEFPFILSILLFTLTAFNIAADKNIEGSSAWENAVRIYDQYSELKPYKMKIYSETYNKKGTLEKTEEFTYSISYGENGETENRLLRAVEDGIDITEKKLKGSGNGDYGGRPDGDMKGMDAHPFDPEVQNRVTARNTGRSEYRKGKYCSVWDFSILLNDKYSGTGTAWINVSTGEAVSLDYRIEPLFPFVEEMKIGMEFKTDEKSRWVLDNISMKGRINLIITKRSFEAVTSFYDYR